MDHPWSQRVWITEVPLYCDITLMTVFSLEFQTLKVVEKDASIHLYLSLAEHVRPVYAWINCHTIIKCCEIFERQTNK